jgi:hypothetical protein
MVLDLAAWHAEGKRIGISFSSRPPAPCIACSSDSDAAKCAPTGSATFGRLLIVRQLIDVVSGGGRSGSSMQQHAAAPAVPAAAPAKLRSGTRF